LRRNESGNGTNDGQRCEKRYSECLGEKSHPGNCSRGTAARGSFVFPGRKRCQEPISQATHGAVGVPRPKKRLHFPAISQDKLEFIFPSPRL
jgi:hypothetical protein